MTIASYHKGLHLLVDLKGCQRNCDQMEAFKTMILAEIDSLQLHVLGSVFHAFENAAFTAVVCLTESHLSVHTWPEFGRVTFDVFLSNYLQVNDAKAHALSKAMQDFFDGTVALEQEVAR